jgi:hypothetical protein
MKRAAAFAILLALSACRAADPPGRPEATCVKACGDRATAKCTDTDCRRGCRLALDRMLEKEGDRVIACVAGGKNRRCDELAWADCSASVGPHADGGPPAPPPGKEDFDEDD